MTDKPDAPAIADLWADLVAAANAGDTKARDFLLTYAPWAADQLADVPKN